MNKLFRAHPHTLKLIAGGILAALLCHIFVWLLEWTGGAE